MKNLFWRAVGKFAAGVVLLYTAVTGLIGKR